MLLTSLLLNASLFVLLLLLCFHQVGIISASDGSVEENSVSDYLEKMASKLKKMSISAQERDNDQFIKNSIKAYRYIGKILSLFGVPDFTATADLIHTVIDFIFFILSLTYYFREIMCLKESKTSKVPFDMVSKISKKY
jgi:hypothetical protein